MLLGQEWLWHETAASLALGDVHGSVAEVPSMIIMINLREVQAELIELSRTLSIDLLLDFDHLKGRFVTDSGLFILHAPSKRDLLRKVLRSFSINL